MAKLILEINQLQMHIGDRQLLDLEHLEIFYGDRIGLIGENGAGKTTLLRLLADELTPDEGSVRRMAPMAFIRQQGNEEAGGDEYTSALFRAKGKTEGCSGGEMTRNRIAGALSQHPTLLLADEPTTDLDGEGLKLLRKELTSFSGSILLVSHDRALLRSLCNRIWYLEDGKITDFPGGYENFIQERERQRTRAAFEYEQYKAERKRLKESAQRMAERASQVRKAPARMGNSEARLHTREWTDSVIQLSHAKRTIQNRMEHLEVKEKPREMPEIRMELGLTHPVGARSVLSFQCDRLTAGDTLLLRETECRIPTGSRTALIGANGCGKTSLLRILTGQADAGLDFLGTVRWNPAVRLAWFDQHHEKTLDPRKNVLENVLAESVHPESFARTVLACLGLRGDAVFKPFTALSGGEKAKTALARMLLTDCNTLLLDEPTNHLDLFTMEELEKLLTGYGGTIVFVSHDEEFIRKTATRIITFEKQELVSHEGTLDEKRETERRAQTDEDRQIAKSMLEMRLAALSARMAAPKKGDRPEALREEYMEIARQIREMD